MLICWESFEKPARQTSEAFLVVAVMLMVMVVVTDVEVTVVVMMDMLVAVAVAAVQRHAIILRGGNSDKISSVCSRADKGVLLPCWRPVCAQGILAQGCTCWSNVGAILVLCWSDVGSTLSQFGFF